MPVHLLISAVRLASAMSLHNFCQQLLSRSYHFHPASRAALSNHSAPVRQWANTSHPTGASIRKADVF